MELSSYPSLAYQKPVHQLAGTVGGVVTPGDVRDSWTCHFLSHGGRKAFEGKPNDLVVGLESAQGRFPQFAQTHCDHFSYLNEPEAQALLRDAVGSEAGLIQHEPSRLAETPTQDDQRNIFRW